MPKKKKEKVNGEDSEQQFAKDGEEDEDEEGQVQFEDGGDDRLPMNLIQKLSGAKGKKKKGIAIE